MITYLETCNKCSHVNVCKKIGIINDFAERNEKVIDELKKLIDIDLAPVCNDFCDKDRVYTPSSITMEDVFKSLEPICPCDRK